MRSYLIVATISAILVMSTSCATGAIPTSTGVNLVSPMTEIPIEFYGDVFFSLDGNVLTTLSADRVQVWDTKTGALLHTIEHSGHYHPIPDLISVRHYEPSPGSLEFWDPKSGTIRLEVPDDLISISFSPDGKTFIGGENVMSIYNAETGERIKLIEDPYKLGLNYMEFEFPTDAIFAAFQYKDSNNPNGPNLLTLFDVNLGRKLIEFPNIVGYDFSPNGQRLITVNREGIAEVWNIGDKKTEKSGVSVVIERNDSSLSNPSDFAQELPRSWIAFSNPLYEVTITSTSEVIDSCTYIDPSTSATNNLIRRQLSYAVTLSNLETGQEAQRIFKGGEPGDCPEFHTFQLSGVPETNYGTPPSKQEFKNWLTSELPVDKLNLNSSNYTIGMPNQFIEDAVFVDDVQILIFYSKSTAFWNGSREINLEKLGISEKPGMTGRNSVKISPDGKQVVSFLSDTLTVSKLDTLEPLFVFDVSLSSKEYSIEEFGYLHNGQAIYAYSNRFGGSPFFKVWDSVTGKQLLNIDDVIKGWTQSKNGQYLAVIQADHVSIWELDKLK